jgi:Glyoxalase-like domain
VARLNNITFACEEPVRLAEFWRDALGYEDIETPEEVLAEAEVERLQGLGATFVEERSQKIGRFEEFWTVMKDPEGNGFCVS